MTNLSYQNMVETVTDFIFFKDLEGHYLDISNSFLNICNCDKIEDVIGKKDFEIFPSEFASSFQEQDKAVIEKRETSTHKNWVHHKKLGKILIETIKTPSYDKDMNLIGIQGISRDITKIYNVVQSVRKKEAALNAIFKTIPLPMMIKALDGHFIYCNKYHREYFGLPDDFDNKTIFDKLYEMDATDTDTIKKLKQQDIDVVNTKTKSILRIMTHLGDNQKYADIIKSPIIKDDGTIMGILCITHDVTEIVKHEDIIAKAKEKAEETAKIKNEFIANVSHEIRTPMNGVLGFIQLLETTELNNEQKDYINEIKKSSKTMLELINNVLDLSKAEAGKMLLENIPFNLRDLADDAASTLVSLVGDKKIDITSYVDSNIHENLIGDPLKLKQVLTNLTSNAVKFTQKGEIRIMVQLIKDYEDEVDILFRVDDTGIGIKQENIEKIFGVFEQADSSTTRKYGGTGLGLAISKRIIEEMHGTLRVESEYGIGSSFSFTAKFKKDLNKPNPDYLQNIDLLGFNVIVYNDNPFTLKCMINYLKEAKVNFIEVTDLQKAIEIIKSDIKIDALVTTYYGENSNLDPILMEEAKKILREKKIPIFLNVSRLHRHIIDKVKNDYNFQKIFVRPVRKRDYYDAIYEYWGKDQENKKQKIQIE